MKKIVKSLLVFTIIIVSVFTLAGCGKTKDDKTSIIGSWEYKSGGYVYKFNKDETGSYTAGNVVMKFTYKDDGKKVSILYSGNTTSSDYEYKIEGNKLIIKDSFGNDVEYVKK